MIQETAKGDKWEPVNRGKPQTQWRPIGPGNLPEKQSTHHRPFELKQWQTDLRDPIRDRRHGHSSESRCIPSINRSTEPAPRRGTPAPFAIPDIASGKIPGTTWRTLVREARAARHRDQAPAKRGRRPRKGTGATQAPRKRKGKWCTGPPELNPSIPRSRRGSRRPYRANLVPKRHFPRPFWSSGKRKRGLRSRPPPFGSGLAGAN